MKAIKNWRDASIILLLACIPFTILFVVMHSLGWIILICLADIASISLLYRRKRLYQDASLIFNNQILNVPSAIIAGENCTDRIVLNETVISSFGLLIGSKIYKWGCDGIKGTRLKQVKIDKDRIWLTFGTEDSTQCIELLHGMTSEQRIIEAAQKLRHETGVTAIIAGS